MIQTIKKQDTTSGQVEHSHNNKETQRNVSRYSGDDNYTVSKDRRYKEKGDIATKEYTKDGNDSAKVYKEHDRDYGDYDRKVNATVTEGDGEVSSTRTGEIRVGDKSKDTDYTVTVTKD